MQWGGNLGIGAAWYEKEAISLGFGFPPTSERFELLEETLQIVHQMWSGDASPYEGVHFSLPYPLNNPQPLSKPHPPIMIGGMGPKKTLRMVAQYGDACNFFVREDETLLVERLKVLKGHCEDLGRPYEDIEKTALSTAAFEDEDIQDIIDRVRRLETIGFEHVIFNIKGDYSVENLKSFTEEIIPAVKV